MAAPGLEHGLANFCHDWALSSPSPTTALLKMRNRMPPGCHTLVLQPACFLDILDIYLKFYLKQALTCFNMYFIFYLSPTFIYGRWVLEVLKMSETTPRNACSDSQHWMKLQMLEEILLKRAWTGQPEKQRVQNLGHAPYNSKGWAWCSKLWTKEVYYYIYLLIDTIFLIWRHKVTFSHFHLI